MRLRKALPWVLVAIFVVVAFVFARSCDQRVVVDVKRDNWIQGTFKTENIVVDNHMGIGGRIDSTDIGTDTGNVCGQAASSNWKGPACWDYHAVANDGIHDIIDLEWNTFGSNASNSGEQIPFVTHVQGNVDITTIASQAIGVQSSVNVVKVGAGHNLSCAAFQGGATTAGGCDQAYSFQGNGGTMFNADDLVIGGNEIIQGNSTIQGSTIAFGNTGGGALIESISVVQLDRGGSVDPTGGGSPMTFGAIGSGTIPSGADKSPIEIFAANGKNAFLLQNSSMAGIKGWSYYNVTNGANSDLKFYNYSLGHDSIVYSGANDLVTFTGGGSFGAAVTMNSHLINNVTDPVGAQDAATKNYVDTHGGVTSSTLTANTIAKATGASAIANSLLSDDATTLAYATSKFTVTAANGNTVIAGTANITGLVTLTAGFSLGADSSAASHKITNLTDPSSGQDAMTLAYANAHYGAGTVTSSTLTSNTIPKATGAAAIGNSALTDDATTLAYATNKFTVLAANGNTAIAGTAGITGLATLTAGFTLGADSTANSHKITSLTNGSSAQDAAAFGQIASAVSGAVVGTANTVAKFTGTNAVGNASFTDNGTTVTFSTNVTLGTHTLTGVTDLTTTGNTTLGDAAADTLTVNATSSFVNPVLTAAVRSTAITPAAITGTTNNWAPTGIGTAEVIYVATSGTATITGLVSTECTNGRTIMLVNISANNVLLPHSSGSSTRPFHNTGGFTWTLYPANDWGHTAELSTITYRCSTTSNSWEQINFSNLAVPGWEIDGQTIHNGTTTIIGGPGNSFTFTNSNHLLSNGGTGSFALACNGTGGTVCAVGACTDLAGSITTNTAATTCTVTFGATYTTSPTCVVSTGSVIATPAYISARSATAITITFPSLTAGTVDYICTGH